MITLSEWDKFISTACDRWKSTKKRAGTVRVSGPGARDVPIRLEPEEIYDFFWAFWTWMKKQCDANIDIFVAPRRTGQGWRLWFGPLVIKAVPWATHIEIQIDETAAPARLTMVGYLSFPFQDETWDAATLVAPEEIIVQGRRVLLCPTCSQSFKTKAGWTKHVKSACNMGDVFGPPRLVAGEPSFNLGFPSSCLKKS